MILAKEMVYRNLGMAGKIPIPATEASALFMGGF